MGAEVYLFRGESMRMCVSGSCFWPCQRKVWLTLCLCPALTGSRSVGRQHRVVVLPLNVLYCMYYSLAHTDTPMMATHW